MHQKKELGAYAKVVPGIGDNRATTYVGNATGRLPRCSKDSTERTGARVEARRSYLL